MEATSVSKQVIQSLRVGDSVGHRQQPERQYEVLTVDEQRLLAVRLAEAALRFIAVRDVVVPF
ncbi:hypothetical protein Lepto7375DRAFT_0952 [Leptolyngbya sp. PCC 7375]|nr:hypothetical protein Lepto7375DRAFT_0952 [Leptolyngbya sp. PCC 7375]